MYINILHETHTTFIFLYMYHWFLLAAYNTKLLSSLSCSMTAELYLSTQVSGQLSQLYPILPHVKHVQEYLILARPFLISILWTF